MSFEAPSSSKYILHLLRGYFVFENENTRVEVLYNPCMKLSVTLAEFWVMLVSTVLMAASVCKTR